MNREQYLKEAKDRRRRMMLRYNELKSYRAVGEEFGISRQRAHVQVAKARAEMQTVKPPSAR